ncbi:hypothetical protein EJ06DRAFT_220391 [Trichodelitschia bisporula]|uniref:Uncharacterized protein n=1 Tax=Trichodelitschia bisporula TaxID=703511 RepID=A0A6G1I941_9PEZI|nr:hypothetical protein EJ06DRAFT_220391 [Trichodelitschia bisporula]
MIGEAGRVARRRLLAPLLSAKGSPPAPSSPTTSTTLLDPPNPAATPTSTLSSTPTSSQSPLLPSSSTKTPDTKQHCSRSSPPCSQLQIFPRSLSSLPKPPPRLGIHMLFV